MKTKRKLVPKSSTIDGNRHVDDVNVVERDLFQNVCGVGNSGCFCIRQLDPMLHSDPQMYVSGMPVATYGQERPQLASTSNVNRPSISNHGPYDTLLLMHKSSNPIPMSTADTLSRSQAIREPTYDPNDLGRRLGGSQVIGISTACEKFADAHVPDIKEWKQKWIMTLFWNNVRAIHNASTSDAKSSAEAKRVTMESYYAYYLDDHVDRYNYLSRTRRLFQQYIITDFCAIEQNRIDFIREHQNDIRNEYLSCIYD
ncbi:hypothetical protein Tco_0653450 [Tanacetum coccineum]|uniref:Uncharacterized protein n=1 Tax=Tanacetum coccineum TaxID=301880 RepID=A0ABQ4X174_9ASTR